MIKVEKALIASSFTSGRKIKMYEGNKRVNGYALCKKYALSRRNNLKKQLYNEGPEYTK